MEIWKDGNMKGNGRKYVSWRAKMYFACDKSVFLLKNAPYHTLKFGGAENYAYLCNGNQN